MRISMAIIWDQAPSKGSIEVVGGSLFGGAFIIGDGEFDSHTGDFGFTNKGVCHMVFAIDAKPCEPADLPTEIIVSNTGKPFRFKLSDVFRQDEGSKRMVELGVTVNVEINYLASL